MKLVGKLIFINLLIKSILISYALYNIILVDLIISLSLKVIIIIGFSFLVFVLYFAFYIIILRSPEHHDVVRKLFAWDIAICMLFWSIILKIPEKISPTVISWAILSSPCGLILAPLKKDLRGLKKFFIIIGVIGIVFGVTLHLLSNIESVMANMATNFSIFAIIFGEGRTE
ncbi:MAG: hypothetical protein ACTSWY_07855 [Promethearchaeota archaeon]